MEFADPATLEWVFVPNPTLEWIAAGLILAAVALVVDMVVRCAD